METVELLVILKLSGEYVKNSLNKYVDSISETHNAYAVLEEVDLIECLTNVLKPIDSLIKTSKASIQFDFTNLKRLQFNKAFMESIFLKRNRSLSRL